VYSKNGELSAMIHKKLTTLHIEGGQMLLDGTGAWERS
jgi:hypothetical protein